MKYKEKTSHRGLWEGVWAFRKHLISTKTKMPTATNKTHSTIGMLILYASTAVLAIHSKVVYSISLQEMTLLLAWLIQKGW